MNCSLKIFYLWSALFLVGTLLSNPTHAQTCTTTVSSCGGAQSAVLANLSTPITVCLADGNYGGCDFFSVRRTAYATIRSLNARNATMSPRVGASQFLRFDSMRFTGNGLVINSCSRNIQVLNTTITPNTPGIYVDGSSCPTTAQNLLFDGVDFTQAAPAGAEGRLSLRDVNTAQIKNSIFDGIARINGGGADGIQAYGSTGAFNITIGPDNVFRNIDQGVCDQYGGAHCDTIQFYTNGNGNSIENNYFYNSSTVMLVVSVPDNLIIRNNVFSNIGDFQCHAMANFLIEHNTFSKTPLRCNGSMTYGTVRNNIFVNGAGFSTAGYETCGGCVGSYNLASTCSSVYGSNCIAGTPTFVGGTTPTTWTGWQLTSTSKGSKAGSDGKDVGVVFPAAPGTLPAPSNLRLVAN